MASNRPGEILRVLAISAILVLVAACGSGPSPESVSPALSVAPATAEATPVK